MVLSTDIERRPVFIQYDGNASLGNFQRCIIDDDFKLIVDIFKDEMFLELYDTKNDPQEAVNLAFSKEYKTRTGVLLRELSAYMQQTGDRLAIPADIYERFLSTYKNSIQE